MSTSPSKKNVSPFEKKHIDVRDVRPIIQVRNLVKKYGDFPAVNNISFDVKRGEIFGILGPNGAGKTTTMEIMETLIEKSGGKVAIDGLDIDIYPEQVKQLVGIQLQHGGFLPDLTLIEILELFASIYNVDTNPIELLQKVSLEDHSRDFVETLSGGQRQRFSLASTLIADPQIVFLDEPTTGLDPQARRNIWEMVLDFKKNGKTVVLTTHYMDEAEYLCDRIAIMDAGKLLEINTAEQFIKDLLDRGFSKPKPKYGATLEDVFLDLTGKVLRD